jgi:hypothetical protein
MDMFTSTEEEFHEKMMAMLITAGTMVGSMLMCCTCSCCMEKSERRQMDIERMENERRARIAFTSDASPRSIN